MTVLEHVLKNGRAQDSLAAPGDPIQPETRRGLCLPSSVFLALEEPTPCVVLP